MTYIYTDLIMPSTWISQNIPVTDHAVIFCKDILDQLIENEQRVRARRKKDLENLEFAVKAVLSALMLAKAETNGGWVYRSVSKKSFANSAIKGDTFNHLIQELDKTAISKLLKVQIIRRHLAQVLSLELRQDSKQVMHWLNVGNNVALALKIFAITSNNSQVLKK